MLLRGVVAPEILEAAEIASEKLHEAGIPHALAGGLAVGSHGYPRTTDDVDFLVGDEAFVTHEGGLVTLKLPLIAVGEVRIDFVSIDERQGEGAHLRPAVDRPPMSEDVPIVPIAALVYMKLKAGRQKDAALVSGGCGPKPVRFFRHRWSGPAATGRRSSLGRQVRTQTCPVSRPRA